ncbi:tripartite tricarboxylate transporter TctB family protein [Stutzerimonas azotifigens]|uniref:tripartite tricarboxylate transporter TctB family protein n=1 Tax=Stutzerimonas azotifigens TaxID=291995 RepID=UPI00040848C6|nr:tripartite tricarboxylate transporter TctB family protein [Stutzerimonas azotifigens]
MASNKKRELVTGAAMLCAGLGYLLLTTRLPGHDGIDATFVPYLLSVMLCVLSGLHILAVFKAPQAVQGEPEEALAVGATPDLKTVSKTLALIVGYISLLKPVGFPIMTAIYLYLQFLVLTPVDQKPRHLGYLIIAVVTSVLVYVLFRETFDLMLPAGVLNF